VIFMLTSGQEEVEYAGEAGTLLLRQTEVLIAELVFGNYEYSYALTVAASLPSKVRELTTPDF
jgi:hypothetical protein